MNWQATHSLKCRGYYMRMNGHELYCRRLLNPTADEQPIGGWHWFIDGILMGCESGPREARAALEAAVRAMSRTHTARLATSTR